MSGPRSRRANMQCFPGRRGADGRRAQRRGVQARSPA
jgi:hypothetical protein